MVALCPDGPAYELCARPSSLQTQNLELLFKLLETSSQLMSQLMSSFHFLSRSLWHLDRLEDALCIRSMMPTPADQLALLKLEERMMRHSTALNAAEAGS